MDLCEPRYISGAWMIHHRPKTADQRDKAGVIGGILKLSPLTSRDKIYLWQFSDSAIGVHT